jgi:hypothetical protein
LIITRKPKSIVRVVKRRKDSPKNKEHAKVSALNLGCMNFRLFAFQPLSIMVYDLKPFNLSIQKIDCRFMLRPIHGDEAAQRTHGGTLIAVDYSLTNETDPLLATKIGLDLINDFFSGVSLVEGVTFRDVEPIQIVCTSASTQREYILVHFFSLSMQR